MVETMNPKSLIRNGRKLDDIPVVVTAVLECALHRITTHARDPDLASRDQQLSAKTGDFAFSAQVLPS